jgi:hypothetical protein
VLAAAAEQPPDPVQRVVLMTAPAKLFLLDSAADLVDDLGAQFDDMEGVQDRDGVGQLVADRVGVAPKPPPLRDRWRADRDNGINQHKPTPLPTDSATSGVLAPRSPSKHRPGALHHNAVALSSPET